VRWLRPAQKKLVDEVAVAPVCSRCSPAGIGGRQRPEGGNGGVMSFHALSAVISVIFLIDEAGSAL
jgi:hypothetical protein